MIDTVFFDAGLTLIYPSPNYAEACQLVAKSEGVEMPLLPLRNAQKDASQFYLSRTNADSSVWSSDETIQEMFDHLFSLIFKEALEECGLEIADEVVTQWGAHVHNNYHRGDHWGIYNDVIPALQYLLNNYYKLYVFSDWNSELSSLLTELDLVRYFQGILTSAGLGVAKAQTGAYERLLYSTGVKPKSSLFIGDNYELDYKPAEAVGFIPILINRDHRECPENTISAEGLDEIVNWLDTGLL
jgi:FMN phosphatase YigB (HAD superfamily)